VLLIKKVWLVYRLKQRSNIPLCYHHVRVDTNDRIPILQNYEPRAKNNEK